MEKQIQIAKSAGMTVHISNFNIKNGTYPAHDQQEEKCQSIE